MKRVILERETMRPILSRLLLATAAVVLATALGHAQSADEIAPPPPPMHGHELGMGGPMMGFFAKSLDLTDAQKAQMKTIMQKERPAMKPLFDQLRTNEQQLHQFEEGTYDDAKVRTLAAAQAQIQTELTVQRTRVHSELFQVLTAEQQSKMKEMEASRAARIQARGHQPPPPPEDQE
jgi:periplasmic protein CpxP/Spy